MLKNFGSFGQARGTDPRQADRQKVLSNLVAGAINRRPQSWRTIRLSANRVVPAELTPRLSPAIIICRASSTTGAETARSSCSRHSHPPSAIYNSAVSSPGDNSVNSDLPADPPRHSLQGVGVTSINCCSLASQNKLLLILG